MNVIKDRFDRDIEKKLSVLGSVPPRDPESAASGRKKFLTEARTLTPPVLNGDESRNWIGVLLAAFGAKKRSPALAALASFVLVLAILFGGTSATVYAAQGSMPDQALYGVKLLSEDLRLRLTSSPQAELELTLDLVDRRLVEIDFLLAAGDDVPDAVVNRMEVHLDQALNIAVAIDDGDGLEKGVQQRHRDRDQDRTRIPESNPVCGTDKSYAGCDGESGGLPSEQPVNSGEGGSGDGSSDVFDPYDHPYDPYHNPEGPPYGPGRQDPAADQGNDDNYGDGPQPEIPPANAYGPGPGGQCVTLPCLGPYGPGYGPDEQPLTPPNSSYGPGEGVPNPDPPSGDGGDGSEDSSGDGSEDSSGDSGSGSSGEDNKAP